jgi:hypothetical protein
VFVPGRLLQPSLMFVVRPDPIEYRYTSKVFHSWAGFELTQKYYAKLKNHAWDIHYRLLAAFVNYGRKKF